MSLIKDIKIAVIGYYFKNNLGDDYFLKMLKKILNIYIDKVDNLILNINYYNIEQLEHLHDLKFDYIIVGGGDIGDKYFLIPLNNYKCSNNNCIIIGVSVGFAYPDLIDKGYIDFFDYIVVRNSYDYNIIKNRFGDNYVLFLPDLVFLDINYDRRVLHATAPTMDAFNICTNLTSTTHAACGSVEAGAIHAAAGSTTIGLFLSQTIVNKSIINNVFNLLVNVISNDLPYKFIYVPFCINNVNNESDIGIYNKLFYKLISFFNYNDIINKFSVRNTNIDKIHEVMSMIDIGICYRYHSYILCIMHNIPFISLSNVPKVNKLLHDLKIKNTCAAGITSNEHSAAGITSNEHSAAGITSNEHSATHAACGSVEAGSINLLNEINFIIKHPSTHLKDICKAEQIKAQKYYSFFNELILENKIKKRLQYPFIKNNKKNIVNYILHIATQAVCSAASMASSLTSAAGSLTSAAGNLTSAAGTACSTTSTVTDGATTNSSIIAKKILYALDGFYNKSYYYGLEKKLKEKNINLLQDVKWLVCDCIKNCNVVFYYKHNYINTTLYKHFNMCYINQLNSNDVHRSGWNYVVSNMLYLQSTAPAALDKYSDTSITHTHSTTHAACGSVEAGTAPAALDKYSDTSITHTHSTAGDTILDFSIDRTFGWKLHEFRDMKIIPYKTSWIGFIHHTDLASYKYNITELFNEKLFLTSLAHCKGIFVLSNYLKNKVKNILTSKNIHVPVNSLVHPTEFVKNTFTIEKFLGNNNKYVIHIGTWMRDMSAIYLLEINSYLGVSKAILKGKYMENYFISSIDKLFIKCCVEEEDEKQCCSTASIGSGDTQCCSTASIGSGDTQCCGITSDSVENKFSQHIKNSIQENYNNVKILNYINNEDYDLLLSKNVVFIKLLDASAVNTVIECCVRNTPIIVNKHPAVVEILGDKYPLYYNTLREASYIISSTRRLYEGHLYLKLLNKDKLKIEHFIKDFINSEIYSKC